MSNVFLILAIISLVSVLLILATGVLGMLKRGGFNQKYGNLLMRARIGAQALVVIFLLLYFFSSNG